MPNYSPHHFSDTIMSVNVFRGGSRSGAADLRDYMKKTEVAVAVDLKLDRAGRQ